MIIDHIGIVVKNMDQGIKHWQDIFGYKPLTEMVVNTRQKVNVVFMTKENSLLVKLIEPTDKTSPIYRFAMKSGGLHHLCFICDKLDNQVDILTKKGLRILVPPQPGEAFENEDIAFVFAGQGLNIEIIDSEKKARKI